MATGGYTYYKHIGDNSYLNYGEMIFSTADGGYLISGYENDGDANVILIKLGSNVGSSSAPEWIYEYGTSFEETSLTKVAEMANGNIVFCGNTKDTGGAGLNDIVVSMLSPAGILQWSKLLGLADDDYCNSIFEHSSGNIAVGGIVGNARSIIAMFTATGSYLWAKSIGRQCDSLSSTTDGGFIYSGFTYDYGVEDYDMQLAKLDYNGSLYDCTESTQLNPVVTTSSFSQGDLSSYYTYTDSGIPQYSVSVTSISITDLTENIVCALTDSPTGQPSGEPSTYPSSDPTGTPSIPPSSNPTCAPSHRTTLAPTMPPTTSSPTNPAPLGDGSSSDNSSMIVIISVIVGFCVVSLICLVTIKELRKRITISNFKSYVVPDEDVEGGNIETCESKPPPLIYPSHGSQPPLLSPSSSTMDKRKLFLSHNWGLDELRRDNHQRVAMVNKALKLKEYSTWFDEDDIKSAIHMDMAHGIKEAGVVLIFVTQKYMDKVKNENDNCSLEFHFAYRRKVQLVAVVMEKELLDVTKWDGPLGMMLGGKLYVDMCGNFDDQSYFDAKISELVSSLQRSNSGKY